MRSFNPGSLKAKAKGCTCPYFDNWYGRGIAGDGYMFGWIVASDCEMHKDFSWDKVVNAG